MNPYSEQERVFPLSGGSTERTVLRAPRLLSNMASTPGFVMGNRAFLRTWAARRAAARAANANSPARAEAERAK